MSGHYKLNTSLAKTNLDALFAQQVVIIRTNGLSIQDILAHPKAKDSLSWAVGKKDDEVKVLTLERLLKPTEKLNFEIDSFIANNTRRRIFVCGHIRMGRNPTMPLDDPVARGKPNEDTVLSFLKKFEDSSKYAIFIASDSDDVKRQGKERLTNAFTLDKPIIHVDRYGADQTEMACEGLKTILFEETVLSKCDILVHTGGNIGHLASIMNRKLKQCYFYDTKSNSVFNNTNKFFHKH